MRANVVAAVKAEVMAVLSHPLAPRMRKFAEHLAYDTDLTSEQAIGCMKALAEDLANPPVGSSVASYEKRKIAAGSLGLADLANADGADGWKAAADAVNTRRFGDKGV